MSTTEGVKKTIRPEAWRRFNATTRDLVETVVDDWIIKYSLDSGNLPVHNADRETVRQWITGVHGRASHQLMGSGMKGFSYSNPHAEALIGYFFYLYLSKQSWYAQFSKEHPDVIPKAIRMHDQT